MRKRTRAEESRSRARFTFRAHGFATVACTSAVTDTGRGSQQSFPRSEQGGEGEGQGQGKHEGTRARARASVAWKKTRK